ncbi:MAG: hypothetical protein SFV15_15005 [Polyangiaceae bacterium]|nr:hypothetical protein [Polyangiaceae bacterium]
MSNFSESLHGLRDVEGLVGSFVLSEDGAVLLRDLPAMFTSEGLAEVGPRITRLRETLSSDGASANVVIRYADHKLILRPLPEISIVAVAEHAINMAQLKMALNLAAKALARADLSGVLASAPAVGTSAGPATARSLTGEATPSAQSTLGSSVPVQRYYRGRPVSSA